MRVRSMVAAGLLIGSAVAGAAPPTAAERVVKTFTDCRAIADPDARLACFDKAAGALESAVKAKDVTIVDRQEVRKARRSLFGFTLPRIPLFGGGDKDDDGKDRQEAEFKEITTTVASTRPLASSRIEIRLAEEELGVWQTNDPVNFPPRAGTKIRIRQGALGNYFLNFEGRTYRGTRLR